MKKTTIITLAGLFSLFALCSCGQPETPGEKIDAAIDEAGDGIEEAGDAVGDAVEKAGDKLNDASE